MSLLLHPRPLRIAAADFDILAHRTGVGGEIQLTDAMCELARTKA